MRLPALPRPALRVAAFALALLSCGQALADSCLNTDSKKGSYSDGDARNSDYVACKPSGPTDTYGSVNAVGSQVQGIIERRQAEEAQERAAFQAKLEANRDRVNEWDRTRFMNLQESTAHAVIPSSYRTDVQVYANASVTPEQGAALRSEIESAIRGGTLLSNYADIAAQADKPWAKSGDPLQNHRMCEVSAELARTLVYSEPKDPAKGFAIAKAGCDAHCGGTCYWLGRIYEDGNKAAPGVDKLLGKQPQTLILQAYDNAIVNGIVAAYEREAELGWQPPKRYKDKTYYDFKELDSYSYWYDIDDYRRLAYMQYKRCLAEQPNNLTCARGVNALIKDTQANSYVWRDVLKDIDGDGRIAEFQALQTKLEAQASVSPAQ